MQQAAFASTEIDKKYVAIRVPLAEFNEATSHLASLGYEGINVTVPLKEDAFRWAKRTDEQTKRIGAANTLKLATGEATNTDAPGFLLTLSDLGVAAPGPVLLLGAGGTARALLVALDGAGYEVKAWNRTKAKLEALVADLGVKATVLDEADPTGCAIIVNTTAAGIHGQTPPVKWALAPTGAIAYDMFYSVSLTPFLAGAAALELTTIDGKVMLAAQGALAFEWWLGKKPSREAMLKAIL